MNKKKLFNEIKKQIEEKWNVWIYEKRAWWEIVFLKNFYKNDLICIPELNDNWILWKSKIYK